jgi:hypothetical protein
MPDITMCQDNECPKNDTCYRYNSNPNEHQSYFMKSPRDGDECDYYYEYLVE